MKNSYAEIMKKIFIIEQIFNDVFSRFYHQLSFQGNFVLKDFYKDKIELSASIIDAIVESILQRIPLTNAEEKKLIDKIYEVWEDNADYKAITEQENPDAVNPIHDPKTVVMVLRNLVEIAGNQITEEQFKKAEEVKPKHELGDYAPVFLQPAKPPFDIFIEPTPSM